MAQPPHPGTKPARDALRREMLAAGATIRDIAIEMRAAFGFRAREAWRHAHGWSQQQAADAMNERSAGRPGMIAADASLLGKWEKWPLTAGRRPSNAVLWLMSEVYGCDIEQLLDLDDRRATPSAATAAERPAAPVPAASPETAVPAPVLPEHPAGDAAVRQAADESALWAQWAETTNVGEIALEQIHADVRRLAADYLGGDAIEVFTRTRTLRDQVFGLLEGHQSPRQAADLYVSAGYLCALLAWMSSDLGHLADADTHGRTAWLCGEKAEHSGLLAWTASTRSKVAFWDGRLRDAVQHARRGATYAPGGTVLALLASQEADAWSRLGAADETQAALRRAEAARDGAAGEDEIGGLFSCSVGRQEQYAAGAHLRIGCYDAALTEADRALEHLQAQPYRAYGTEAQTVISQAMGLVGLGQPEGLHEVLAPVLELPAERRLDTVVGRMRDLTVMMSQAPGGRGASSMQARAALADWCQDSAPRRLALSPGSGAP
jgi:tetratricopeptide (TPR) repeat protein